MDLVQFETDTFTQLYQLLNRGEHTSVWVLMDENTEALCFPVLEKALKLTTGIKKIVLPAGEQYKNIDSCQLIWQTLLNGKADRKALLLNLGGGVIGDMGGFCAVAYKRGIDFIQIPTTLLAQVDASVGGKLGVDFGGIKNAIGSFHDPLMTFIHSGFLKTLPERELRSGFAEVIKHCLIADAGYWNLIREVKTLNDPKIDWNDIIAHSVSLKSKIVEQDPKEMGLRKILNFGHTIGHAVESMSWETDNPLLHGEAVAFGMICEAFLSKRMLNLTEAALLDITDYISTVYPYWKFEKFSIDRFFELLWNDKKNNGKIQFSLLNEIGYCSYNTEVFENLILDSLRFYDSIYGK
jgi:3-dehydroquinate synthase